MVSSKCVYFRLGYFYVRIHYNSLFMMGTLTLHGVAPHNQSSRSSLLVLWSQVKEFEPLHDAPKMMELCLKVGPYFILFYFLILKFKPKLSTYRLFESIDYKSNYVRCKSYPFTHTSLSSSSVPLALQFPDFYVFSYLETSFDIQQLQGFLMFEVQKTTINIETMFHEAIQGCDYQDSFSFSQL